MKLLLLAQARFIVRAPWSALTAVLGVALAVASVVAVHQIGTAVNRSLEAARPPHLAGVTHLLLRPGLSAAHYFTLRAAWREANWPDVQALVPLVEGHLEVDGRRSLVLGADWLALLDLQQPESSNTAALPLPAWRLLDGASVAVDRSLHLSVGQRVPIAGTALEVATVIDAGLGPALFADIGIAQRLLGRSPEALSFITMTARDPWANWRRVLDALMPGAAAGLPEPTAPRHRELADFEVRPVASELPQATFARAILFNVGALGLLALLVAWFLVHQVALIWVERQRPVLVGLHALGVTHGALALGFVAGLTILGAAATLLGTGFGLWLASALIRVSASGMTGAALPVAADSAVVAKALISGVGICIGGGALAFREANPQRSSLRRLRGWPWALVIALALALATLGIVRESSGLFGGFGAILAMCLLAVAGVAPLLKWLRSGTVGAPDGRVWPSRVRSRGTWGLLARLGLREALWRPEIVAVALAALALAIATSMGIGLMVESLRSDFARMLESRLSGDLYVNGPAGTVAAAARWLERDPAAPRVARYGVAKVRVASAGARSAGTPAQLSYGRLDAEESARYGHSRALLSGQALVNERLARTLGVAVGATIMVAGAPVAVAGVFAGFGDAQPRLVVDSLTLRSLGLQAEFDRLVVRLPGASRSVVPASGRGAAVVSRLAERFSGLEVVSRDVVRDRAFDVFDRTFAITRALTLLALLVASVGVYNALTALRLNQAPTRRLLEVQGVLRWELALVTLVRATSVGVLAMVIAAPLGFAMAWILCHVINPRAFGWTIELDLAPGAWLPPLLLGLVATLFAGLLPAPREQGELDATL